LWDGLLATGSVTLLAGRPKVGKSTLLFALAAAVTRGRPLLGAATRPAKVLLLSEERGDTLREKRERWRLTDDVHLLMRHQAGREKWPDVVERCAAYCAEHELAALVVDTWDKWAGLAGDSENSSGSVLEALRPLTDAAAGGLAVLVSAHQRKSFGEFGEAVRGSNALTGAVDIIVEIERAKVADGGSARVLRTVSRFDQAPPDELVVMLDADGYQARGSLVDVRTGDEREAVFSAVALSLTALRAEDVAAATDIPKATAHKRLGELMDQGRLTRTGEGKKGDPYLWQLFDSSRPEPLSDGTNVGGAS
jgi:predicted ATP-dependent serine protease